MKERRFKCNYCGKRFVSESRFINHRCKEMQRHEEMETPLGQGAWRMYQKWMKQQHRQMPGIQSFIHSRYYTIFIRFMKFANRVNIPDRDLFVWFMVEKRNPPELWINDEIYASYLEFLDRSADPYKRAKLTIDTLFKYADAAECEVGQVFDALTSAEVIQLLRERRLSPWILLRSSSFKRFLATVSSDEMIMIETIIRPQYWVKKFQDNPQIVEKMDLYVQELNL